MEEKSPPSTSDSQQQEPQLNIPATDEPIIEGEQPITHNPPPVTEQDMEVHHHAHDPAAPHHKKNWKSYFWEFLMLFLAVFCGFLAEYQLEQTIERHREKEFIISMIEDAEADTAMIHEVIPENLSRIAYADSQAIASINYKGTQIENSRIYRFHRYFVYRPDLIYPTDRTLFQLKNSGGMRLIRNKKAAACIDAYDRRGKMVINQQSYYEEYLTQTTEASAKLLNYVELHKKSKTSRLTYDSVKLINPDQTKLLELANKSIMFKGVMQMYVVRLQEMEKEAINLIATLKKEYHLE
ncbi:hypothetical protein [Lacibacter sediminis]|uniref:Uncharacterized protein n=1 Tax=Lacibacter sediminis TaxID=2760713 RepID=A0A7G5XGE5_9BACT|nr:hypothetical protein [Lacibacter sediminis]QNA44548.1 hypothetical protein H4075_21225 [Lacibacter sediminis]